MMYLFCLFICFVLLFFAHGQAMIWLVGGFRHFRGILLWHISLPNSFSHLRATCHQLTGDQWWDFLSWAGGKKYRHKLSQQNPEYITDNLYQIVKPLARGLKVTQGLVKLDTCILFLQRTMWRVHSYRYGSVKPQSEGKVWVWIWPHKGTTLQADNIVHLQMNEPRAPSCLGYIEKKPTQFRGDYNEPFQGFPFNNQYNGK